MIMQIVNNLNSDQLNELVDLFQNEWWSKGRTLNDTSEAVDNSSFICGLLNDEKSLIAFGRVLTDTRYKALILDVIVREDLRGERIGEKLFHAITSHPKMKNVNHFELFCKDEMVSYYESFGFRILEGEQEMRKLNL